MRGLGISRSLLPGRQRLSQTAALRRRAVTSPATAVELGRVWGARYSSVSQRPGSEYVNFPGAVNSKFTSTLQFERPDERPALPTYRFMDQNGEVLDKTVEIDLTPDEIVRLYKDMLTVSIMDVIMFDAQRQGRISFYMVSAGEEGIAVGSASALKQEDVVFSQYREAGVYKQRGYTLDDFMNQLFGNVNDSGLGRNMPVHYGSRKLNMHTISSPLATQLPQAAGAAYALKMQKLQNPTSEARVAACYFGEGAASEGDFHAALNIAATRSCPVIFICRNNGYAISTPTLEQYRGDGIASRGIGYGIETIRVDGNDIFAVREATRRARQIALNETGEADDCRPVLIEAMSYRVSHHSTSDDSFAYRARVEVEDWKRRDNPITRLRKYMERQALWDAEQEKTERARIRKDVLTAFSRAERSKKPSLDGIWKDVYAEKTEEQLQQMSELRRILETYPAEYDVDEYEGGIVSLKE